MSLRQKYKQYGPLNFYKRMFFSILRRLGFRYNKWLICQQEINLDILPKIVLNNKFHIREIKYKDFINSNKFSDSKLKEIKKRLISKNIFAYGAFCNNDLAYYNWISLKEFQFSNNDYEMCLKNDEGLIFDAFCFPKYRGNNLHNFMNTYRLKMLVNLNKSKALGIVLNENIPARKTQKKAGFVCNKIVETYSVFGINWYKETLKKINL